MANAFSLDQGNTLIGKNIYLFILIGQKGGAVRSWCTPSIKALALVISNITRCPQKSLLPRPLNIHGLEYRPLSSVGRA